MLFFVILFFYKLGKREILVGEINVLDLVVKLLVVYGNNKKY